MVKRCSLQSAQRSYDNRSDDFEDDHEMDCPECGKNIELEDTGFGFDVNFTGTCKKCGTECEYDEDQF